MSIKLIAIDIDGTLIDSNHQLPAEVITALKAKAAAGIKIVLCSGRPILGMLPFVEQLGLLKENEYTISYNGALVQRNDTLEPLIKHTLNHEDFTKVEQLSRDLGVKMHTVDLDKMYTANREISEYTVFDAYATKMPLEYRPAAEMPTEMIINKMMFCEAPDVLAQAITKIPKDYFSKYNLIHSMPFFFEILHPQASKGFALRDLAAHLGIQQAEIMAIGDNENDLDMLAYAGIGVAMGNATENAKKAANVVTKTNDQFGVAHAVNTWA